MADPEDERATKNPTSAPGEPVGGPRTALPGGADGRQPGPVEDEPVPKLGRGRRRRKITYFPPGEIISIFALIIGLIAVVSLKDSCARGAEGLFKAFEAPLDAGAATVPRPPAP